MSVLDRILGNLRAIVREELSGRASGAGVPAGAVFAPWEYAVTEATDTAITARRADSSCPWPDVVQVPIFPGIAGARYRPAVGSIVGLAFANGDPSKPRIVWADQTVPVTTAVDGSDLVEVGPSAAAVEVAGGGAAIHRVDDLGSGGSITAAAALVYAGADGSTAWSITAVAGPTPVTFTLVPATGTPGALVTKATTGSTKGSCG